MDGDIYVWGAPIVGSAPSEDDPATPEGYEWNFREPLDNALAKDVEVDVSIARGFLQDAEDFYFYSAGNYFLLFRADTVRPDEDMNKEMWRQSHLRGLCSELYLLCVARDVSTMYQRILTRHRSGKY